MILEFGTLRSECVLNASEGVSTRNGIEWNWSLRWNSPIPYQFHTRQVRTSDLVEHIESISTILC